METGRAAVGSGGHSGNAARISHAERKSRTRAALVQACRQLISTGADVSMPAVSELSGVSEATAYRHFPDLVSLVNEALRDLWPTSQVALAPIAHVTDPVQRIGFACDFLLRRVHAYQGSVRAVIAATVTRPSTVPTRPGLRFGLIDAALDPALSAHRGPAASTRITQLKIDLSAVVSAEALFSLTDLRQVSLDEAIASLCRTAETITRVAVADLERCSPE